MAALQSGERMNLVPTARIPVAEPARARMRVAALNKRYGDQHALADVSFAVNAGETLGLIGPNGAGKTTLLEAVAGLVPIDSGEVFWGDRPLSQG